MAHASVTSQIAVDAACERIRAILEAPVCQESQAAIVERERFDREYAGLKALLLERDTGIEAHKRAIREIALTLQSDLSPAEKLKRIGWWIQSI